MRVAASLPMIALLVAGEASGEDEAPSVVAKTTEATPPHARPPIAPPPEDEHDTEPCDPQRTCPAPEPVDWSSAPRPEEASGIEREEATPASERVRTISRALLFVPRWLVWGVAQPVRGGAYIYDRYDLPSLYDRTFYSDNRLFGIYPTAMYESGFGFTGGLRVVHNNALGAYERLKLRAGFGGRYWFAYGVNLRSGDRLGERAALELDFAHERRPNERFTGIGNLDELPSAPDMPLDPRAAAFKTRFREDLVRGMGRLEVDVVGPLEVRLSGALASRELSSTGDADSIEQFYMLDRLAGWNGVEHARIEGELVYDSRRPTSPYQSQAIDATGWLARGYVGATRGIGGDPSSFQSYGGEVQRYIDLYRGSRVLALRVLADSVVGDGPISFLDLPRLGGTEFLRGYPNGRFRDRAAGLATAEYTWDLGNWLAAYTFVDIGRVWPSFRDIELSDLRVGYGGGIQLHTKRSYIGRAQVAASRDGDVFLELVLSPAFPRRERLGRF